MGGVGFGDGYHRASEGTSGEIPRGRFGDQGIPSRTTAGRGVGGGGRGRGGRGGGRGGANALVIKADKEAEFPALPSKPKNETAAPKTKAEPAPSTTRKEDMAKIEAGIKGLGGLGQSSWADEVNNAAS
jgi:hypothetical protein